MLPSSAGGAAIGGDIVDICAIEFADDIAPDFFSDKPYIINDQTVGTSSNGHELHIVGVLKGKTEIIPPNIKIGFCRLEFHDVGVLTSDPVMRQAEARFMNPAFDSVTGISGSPVFDQTANVLCGMVARGGMMGSRCIIHYIDAFDILQFLKGIGNNSASVYYTKAITPQLPRHPARK